MAISKINTNSIADDAVTTAKVNPAQTDITSVGTLTSFASTGIDDNADATTMTIDTSERIGVGTTTMNRQVVLNNNSLACLQLTNSTTGVAAGAGSQFQQSGNSGYIGNYSGSFTLFTGASGTAAQVIDANGHVTKPLNSAFYCTGGAQSNLAINANVNFFEGTGSEVYDVNADLSLSDNVGFSPGDVRYFTAPVTAKYMFTFRTRLDSMLTSPDYIWIYMKTSNRNYTVSMFDPDFMDSTPNYYTIQGTVIADMDTGDTAYPYIYISGGSATIDSSSYEFSGILIG